MAASASVLQPLNNGPKTKEKSIIITLKDQSDAEFQHFLGGFMFPLSIFGASTFMIITQQMTDPADIISGSLSHGQQPIFSLQTVRTFIAIAWLCFILTLALTGFASSGFVLLRKKYGHQSPDLGQVKMLGSVTWGHMGILVSLVLYILIITAFMFLSLAMAAYVGAVGWVAVGCCALAGVAALTVTLVDK
jgi:hypothetical protein